MLGDLTWHTLVAIIAGVAVVGLILWVGLRNQSAATPQAGTQPDQSTAPTPNMVSRIVSWTSMLHRGSYRGPTRSLRRRGNSVDVLITDPMPADNDPVKGWVLERSVHTVTFVAEEAIAAGTVARVRPLNAADEIPWLEIAINECSQAEAEWRLACKFVKLPPYNILMLFG
jgi:hypothetical protein